jgi:rhomboid protease GluP
MYRNSKMYMPTFTLITVNVIVYAYTYVVQGEVWRLFTAMFIHADIVHLFGNMFFLFIFGLRAEEMFDMKEYMLIYFLSGLAGGFLTLMLWPLDTLSVGASGAIFGMVGATIIYARRSIGQSIITALLYAFFLFFLNLGGNVNYLAHLGGLVVGLLIGYLLATSRKPRQGITYHYRYSYSS